MMPDGSRLDSTQIGFLSRLLDVAQLRHDVIAQNVANVNTPGFKRQDVEFEEAFARALASGNEAAALRVAPTIGPAEGGIERADGNNVDIDMEIGQLHKNSTLYKVYTQILAVQLSQMRSAITGR